MLVFCLRLVGIDDQTLPWDIALATYTVARLSTVIQITPGGVGVVEVAYTAAFVAVTSSTLQTTITAGVSSTAASHTSCRSWSVRSAIWGGGWTRAAGFP